VVRPPAARTALAPALDNQGSGGAAITQDDLDRLAQRVALDDLQDIAALLSADAVRNASGSAELDAALQSEATAFAADHYGDTTVDGVVARIDADKALASAQPEPESLTRGGATLRSFTYTDAGNWSFRSFQATEAQDTPDAQGMAHFTDHRKRAVNGTVQSWGDAADFTLSDVYWTGSEWFACPTTFESSRTLYDANGSSTSLYCKAWTGTSKRSASDIGGAKISDVVAQIRAFPLHDSHVDYPTWGPSPDDPALAGLTFPAGSTLLTYDNTDVANPDAYGTAPNSIVTPYVTDVANGVQAACNQVSPANSSSFTFTAATLEQLVAAYPGKPCVFTANASTGPRNEWWSNSTISIGIVAAPAPSAGTVYAASRSIRIGFGSGNAVTYYRCSVLASSGSSRNCDVIGSGSYSVESLGDARVMRFAGVPADAAPLTYTRLFVERGGVVYYGFHTKPRHDANLRLNAVATDALFAPLGITR
jgi:trimeric autotransporter adhesin